MINPNRLRQIYLSKGDGLRMWDLCSMCVDIVISGSTKKDSPVVVDIDTERLRPGFLVFGWGIQDDTKILLVDGPDQMIMDKDSLGTNSGDEMSFVSCRLAQRCRYVKKGHCMVESRYLGVVCNPVIKLLKSPDVHLTELDWLDFGLKQVPLYQDLIRVKKEKAALDSVLINTVHGVKVHPLFKEARDIMKAIDSLPITRLLREKFRELGLKDVTSVIGDTPADELMERDGDPDFADSLMGKG